MTKRHFVAAMSGSLIVIMGAALSVRAERPAGDAEALIEAGHWKRARTMLESRAKAQPQDPKILCQLAQVKMAFQDFDDALPLARRAVELDAKNSKCHLILGQVYGEMAARASFFSAGSLAAKFRMEVESALELDPQNLEALDSMMQFKFRAPGFMGGSKEQARGLAERILQLNPSQGYIAKAELAELENNVAQVEDCYRKAVEADPKSYRALTLLAGFYSHAPHASYDLAVKFARQAIVVDPTLIADYGILARVFALKDQWSDLESVLTAAQTKVPDDLKPYYEASNALLETGKELPRAEGYARNYLSQEPEGDETDAADAHRQLGLVLEKEGRTTEARTEMETALRLRPNFKAAKEDLARIGKR